MELAEQVEEIATGKHPEMVISLITAIGEIVSDGATRDSQYSVGDWHRPFGR